MQEAPGIHLRRKECGLKRREYCFRIVTNDNAHNYTNTRWSKKLNKRTVKYSVVKVVDNQIIAKLWTMYTTVKQL